MRQRLIEPLHHKIEPVCRAGIGGLGAHPGSGSHRRHHRHLIPDAVEDDDQRRAHQDAVGKAEPVRRLRREVFDQPHRVVAHIAENAGGHGRQLGRQGDGRLRQQRPERSKRGQRRGRERVRVRLGRAVDLGLGPVGAPDEIRLAADDGIAAARGAPFHQLQKEAVRPLMRELQHGRDRGLQIGDQPRPGHLRHALVVTARETGKVRLDGVAPALLRQGRDGGGSSAHGVSSLPISLARAGWLIFTP